MIEATTNSALRRIAETAHRERSLAAWRMIDALRALATGRVRIQHEKRAARRGDPFNPCGCTA